MNGAQILIECLKREGVEVAFGYPGGVVLPLFDQLYDAPLRFILKPCFTLSAPLW